MFKNWSSRFIYLAAAGILVLSLAGIYGVTRGLPAYKQWAIARTQTGNVKPTVQRDTRIRQEIRYLCGDKVSSTVPTTSDLVGLDFPSLVKKYPVEEGWSIDDAESNTLVLARVEPRVCPFHRDFRHIGISDGFMAVYEGPLGYNQKVLQRDDISVEVLPLEIQQDLGLSMDYERQDADTQGRLKNSYEFENEDQLNAVLENFDEYRE